jgi:hypothetical protein
MELVVSLFIVSFFVLLNEIRVGLLGEDNKTSELLIAASTIIAGFLFSLVASA